MRRNIQLKRYDTWHSVESGRNYIHGMLEFIICL